ncbi:hypothetical protein K2Z84_27495, partial [Candidatus Binatia bacterium]|nr:hypothetical protein [Candidatus Binatia bacterium]
IALRHGIAADGTVLARSRRRRIARGHPLAQAGETGERLAQRWCRFGADSPSVLGHASSRYHEMPVTRRSASDGAATA